MTISSTANKIIYNGNGATTSFPFTFPAIDSDDIVVYYTDSAGTITTLVEGSGTTQYQLTLNAAVPPNPTGAGGTVTYNPSGSPIATGTTLTIIRTMPLTQDTALANQGNMYPSVIEQALDSVVAQIQQLGELLGRQITVAVSDPTPDALPPAAQRAGKYLSFDSNGNPVAATTITGTPVSSAMAPVVGAATLAAGRTAFGLGNVAVENIGSGLQDDGAGSLRANLAITTTDTTNQAVTLAFHNTQRAALGPLTYTLPRANTLWNGFGFKVEVSNSSGVVTFAINVNDNFQNYTSGTSLLFSRGSVIELWTDASASGIWYYNVLSPGRRGVSDADFTITPSDRYCITSSLSAPRTWTLPTVASVKAGTVITISDEANAVTATNTIAITVAGADSIVAQGTTITVMTLRSAGDLIALIGDGVSKWNILSVRFSPRVQTLTSGTGATYTATVGCRYQWVRAVAGGGGGGAQATNDGSAGTNTSFQVNATGTAWTAVAGSGGPNGGAANTGGSGGGGGTNGTGTLINRYVGAAGWPSTSTGATTPGMRAAGGSSSLFPAPGPRSVTGTGVSATANTGNGGGGGGTIGTASGGGGGGGETVEFIVAGMATATYTVGAGGNGGAAGTQAGGNGGSGVIIIVEYF